VEFKQAGNDYDTNKIGEYFSVLSNEANLRGLERAWLVFGVSNKTRGIVGTSYREDAERLHSLKQQVLALDRVQKQLPIPDEAVTRLKRAGLIEGRKPRFYVSASVAKATASKADYIRTRAQDDEFYAKLVID